jgi:hypothetical protein
MGGQVAVRAGYRSDLSAITLDESGDGPATSWVQALKIGSYNHPVFGEITIDDARSHRFAAHANARVRGIDMDVDYDHKARRDDAAGWVVQTEARPDGVWYLVEWTDEAAEKIRRRQYRYFSSEFADEWTHPETGVTYQDVLFGGGITNRPFIKGMVPLNLSESEAAQARLAEEGPAPTGDGGATEGGRVDLTKLRTTLKLSEGTSDEDVIEAVLVKLAEASASKSPAKDDDVTKLAESNPVIAKLLAENAERERRLAEMETAMTFAEVKRSLAEVDAGTSLAVTPAVKELAEPLLVKLPTKERAEVVAILRKFAEGSGTATLGGQPTSDPTKHAPEAGDAVTRFTELVSQIQSQDKLDYRSAVNAAVNRDPSLFNEYRLATDMLKVSGGGN